MDSLKSVSELRKTYEEQCELRVKRSNKYWGASSCRDLKAIVLDSAAMSCSMVFQPSWSISGLLSVKAAAGYNSSSSVLTLLQTGTTPNRATISKVWLDNTCWLHKESKAFENSCST